MAEYTPNLNLLKKDPVADGNDTFNIQTMLNDNWDKIDDFAKAIEEGLGNVDDVEQVVGDLIEQVGNLEELDTETKTNLIGAINEIYQDLMTHKAENTSQHGDLSALKTSQKSSLVEAINELFTNVSNGKDLISRAITDIDDSIVIPTNPTFSDLANIIGGITTGLKSANGTTYLDSNGNLVVSGLDFKPYISFGAADPGATFGQIDKEPFDIPQDVYANRNSNHVQGGFTVYNALKGSNDEPYKWWAFGE